MTKGTDFEKKENVNMDVVVLCQIQRGVIETASGIIWNYITSVVTVGAIAKIKYIYSKTKSP